MSIRLTMPFSTSPHRHLGSALLTGLTLFMATVPWLLPPKGLLTDTVMWASLTGFFLLTLLTRAHERGSLCSTCIDTMPLAAQEEADRRRMWLWVCHKEASIGAVALRWLLLAAVAIAFMIGVSARNPLVQAVISTLLICDAGYTWARQVHSRFAPWCPWCRNGGPGDGKAADQPTPAAPQSA
ncbi:hypothetical protein [Streptomyces sp. NPDC054838]